jgi:hypothetical protein
MNVLKRLIPYIILNILVSAVTTWGMLTWWNNTHPPTVQPIPTLINLPAIAPTSALPNPTPFPPGVKMIEIGEVSGAGDIANETILLRRVGEGELRLNGWRLDDSKGHSFTFPDIVLNKGGAVRVFTRSGNSTVNELYWGLKEAAWTPGKTVSLYDDQGIIRATVPIP